MIPPLTLIRVVVMETKDPRPRLEIPAGGQFINSLCFLLGGNGPHSVVILLAPNKKYGESQLKKSEQLYLRSNSMRKVRFLQSMPTQHPIPIAIYRCTAAFIRR